MTAERSWHESFMIRMWAEPNGAERILRGAIQNVQTGRTTYFDSTKLATDIRTTQLELERKLKNHRPPVFDVRSLGQMNYFIGGHKSQLGLIKRATALNQTELVVELEQQLEYWVVERGRWVERSRFGGYAKTDPEVAELAKADDRIAEIATELVANHAQPWTAPKETHLYVRVDGGLRRAEDLLHTRLQ